MMIAHLTTTQGQILVGLSVLILCWLAAELWRSRR